MYKFHDSDTWGMHFFIFASCEPLIAKHTVVRKLYTWD